MAKVSGYQVCGQFFETEEEADEYNKAMIVEETLTELVNGKEEAGSAFQIFAKYYDEFCGAITLKLIEEGYLNALDTNT